MGVSPNSLRESVTGSPAISFYSLLSLPSLLPKIKIGTVFKKWIRRLFEVTHWDALNNINQVGSS